MKQRAFVVKAFFCFCFTGVLIQRSGAQENDCIFGDALITIHFGKGNVQDINASPPDNYGLVSGSCPNDGHYSFTSATANCFGGEWFTLTEDHTPNDLDGNMMLVNAWPGGGAFLNRTITGLKGNSTYELAAWLMNVCRIDGYCEPLPANITMRLKTLSGKIINEFQTGELAQTGAPRWTRYRGFFTMPVGETTLVLTMLDITIGGCGNDFALDDITIRECLKPDPPVVSEPKPVATPITKPKVPVDKPVVKKEPVKQSPVNIKTVPAPVAKIVKDSQISIVPGARQKPAVTVIVPFVLRTRENTLFKRIETEAAEIIIDLYDNAQIDGDTVSVYHNNQIIVSGAMLSTKPITFRILVDPQHKHHELVMVAHNLGSIPPNTALMVIKANDKRYEVFLSSSEQKNAKVLIDLAE